LPPKDTNREPLLAPLYPILDASYSFVRPAAVALDSLARAGCRLVQLRAKELATGAFYEWAREAVKSAEGLGIQIRVNDRADVALAVGASGVHLGQEDLSPSAARQILGPSRIIGLSTHSVEQAREAARLPIDYVAIGPVFATKSKKSAYRPLGPEGVRRARQVVTRPLVAIGGIGLANGREVLEAGADSLAVISALMEADDLETAARAMLEAWTGAVTSDQ
jgi:thiamine-phosphate pyrophosphorylase